MISKDSEEFERFLEIPEDNWRFRKILRERYALFGKFKTPLTTLSIGKKWERLKSFKRF